MPLNFTGLSFTINRALVFGASTPAYVVGAFLDGSSNNLYVIGQTASGNDVPSPIFKRLDLSNPAVPIAYDWLLSNTSEPVDLMETGPQSFFFYDSASSYVYFIWARHVGTVITGGDVGVDYGSHLFVGRINIGTGEVQFGQQELHTQGSIYKTKLGAPVRGIIVKGTDLYLLSDKLEGHPDMLLGKWSIAGVTYATTKPADQDGLYPGIVSDSERVTLSVVDPAAPDNAIPSSLAIAADGKLLVFHGPSGKVEKYSPTDLTYEGYSTWPTNTDVTLVTTRAGYHYTLNLLSDGENLSLAQFFDTSTNVVDPARCIARTPERTVWIGDNEPVEFTFEARDGYGAPMPQLVGKMVRVTLVTTRNTPDGDDAALSLSSDPSTFRNAAGLPVHTTLNVPFDALGVARFYAQSARVAAGNHVIDMIRIDYP